jgi:sRNA-binding protein
MSIEDPTPVPAPKARKAQPKRDASLPTLEKLAALYPHLFGAVFLPLKRGIFQDLLTAHPEAFDKEALKAALSTHTRSTRYLNSVASGQKRHDLLGEAVEAMAPEHIHHAILEVFRRRQNRTQDDLKPQVLERMVQAISASGLTLEAYAEQTRTRDDTANALLDEALALARERSAKGEALLRAFNASGQTVEAFADMYGLNPQDTARTLERARNTPA